MRMEMLSKEKQHYEALISPKIEEVKQELAIAESNEDEESVNTLTYDLNVLTGVQREWFVPLLITMQLHLQLFTDIVAIKTGYSAAVLAGAIVGAIAATVLLYTAVLGVVIAAVVIRQRKKK